MHQLYQSQENNSKDTEKMPFEEVKRFWTLMFFRPCWFYSLYRYENQQKICHIASPKMRTLWTWKWTPLISIEIKNHLPNLHVVHSWVPSSFLGVNVKPQLKIPTPPVHKVQLPIWAEMKRTMNRKWNLQDDTLNLGDSLEIHRTGGSIICKF